MKLPVQNALISDEIPNINQRHTKLFWNCVQNHKLVTFVTNSHNRLGPSIVKREYLPKISSPTMWTFA